MTSIKNLEMAKTISTNGVLTIKKGFLGLSTKVVLSNSGETVAADVKEYNIADGDKLQRILNMKHELIANELQNTKIQPQNIGNARLELITSASGSFVMMQLYRFSDFKYKPVTPMITFEGSEAQTIGKLLN